MKSSNVWKTMIGIFAALALFAQGENWIYRYDSGGNDFANLIAYGAGDNIYVAGYTTGSPPAYYDIIVISLTSTGDTNWIYTYNGPGNDWDEATSIICGSDGNIYAAGYCQGDVTSQDLIVISLASTGDTNWIYTYNGPGNSWDAAYSIVTGIDGNLYVAGYSYGIGTSTDFTILSVTPAGDTNWVYRYNSPENVSDAALAIAYGLDGNIYATGYSGWDDMLPSIFTVVSLTNSGDTNWIYRYNEPGCSNGRGNSIAYGADGSIYAAGRIANSAGFNDFLVISLTPTGDTNWVYRYDGPGNMDDEASSIAYGADGNIYAAGSSRGGSTGYDFTIVSLTPAGDERWIYRYNGPGNGMDKASRIVLGEDGNIYGTGFSYCIGPPLYSDLIVISLTVDGDTNWVYRYNGPANQHDFGSAIVCGTDYNIHVAGISWGGYWDIIVISLPPNVSVKEKNTNAWRYGFGTTIASGPLQLPEGKKCRIFDITGRVVEPNKMKPGIYFIEIDGKMIQKVIKVR